VSIKDANRICKTGAKSPHSYNALILQGHRNTIDWGDAD
jgi:hypothetical protein